MLTTYPEADHIGVMKVHAEGRATGADVRPQVTCLPLKVQLRMDNPYYFRTVPIFLELLGRDPSEFPAFYGDPAWRAEATRQVSVSVRSSRQLRKCRRCATVQSSKTGLPSGNSSWSRRK